MNAAILAGGHGLLPYLLVAAALFACGAYAVMTRRNAVGFLIGVELMLSGAVLNTVAYARARDGGVAGDGQVLALILIILAAAEALVALAVIFAVYRVRRDIDLDTGRVLPGPRAQDLRESSTP
jgi:NADH:ubiquinone oxidoreductase subunit K